MTDRPTRRSIMKHMVVGATLGPLAARLTGTAAAETNQSGPLKDLLEPFDYEGVRLSEGPLLAQYTATRDYYFRIPDDDMLKGFRTRAGLAAPGEELGGWYSGDPSRRTWWSRGDTFNTFGQWLSGMARMSRATGDTEMRLKAIHLMTQWGETIEPDGYFFYSRHPWQPHYIYDKMVCGLVDMARYAGRSDALGYLARITDWAAGNLDRSRKVDSNTEWYTLSENLYRAYELTGEEKYRSFGDLWRFTDYWKAFVGETGITRYNHHAYSHVNTQSSAAMTFGVTGDPQMLAAIVAAYDWLQQTQCYATGGYGPDEELVPSDGELGRRLETTFCTFETPCGCWAGFKLARYLMNFTGEARYGDWIERLLYNGILGALPMGPKGATFYYSDYRIGGARKIYHIDGTWPCCSGTYPQVVADYHDVIYFRSPNGLAVNLFVPSRVAWNQAGTEVTVEQETAFPDSEETDLFVRPKKPAVFDVRFRVPAWTRDVTVKVNGERLEVTARPGTWATIRRTWKPADRVSIRLPMRLALAPVDAQHPNRRAVVYGPVVLVRNEEPRLVPSAGDPGSWIRPQGAALRFAAAGQPNGEFLPFYRIGAGQPYNMYFDLTG
jgi:uncharacterized protein